jgi:DHA3 family macrolide efflux protein-like MFS transporter
MADRFNRKYIIIVTDLIIALFTVVLAVLFILSEESLVLVYIILGLRSLGLCIQEPASTSLVPMVVPEEAILKANGVTDFTEVSGGFNAISKTSVPKTNFVCQSKVLNS